jgi:hypothetical protein
MDLGGDRQVDWPAWARRDLVGVLQVEALMKAAFSMVLGLAFVAALVVRAQAEDKKEVELKGTILCAKCELKESAKCANCIRVKEDDKDVVYYLDDTGAKAKYHKDICQGPKEGTVKGTVTEKDGKKWIKPSKDGVTFKE